jgi:pyruvate dehydrogenase E2 component (dihydrolipoamide acetyltransferase)
MARFSRSNVPSMGGINVTGVRASSLTWATRGVDEVLGIIYPPQVARLGFGRVAPRPWAENGMLGAIQTLVTI